MKLVAEQVYIPVQITAWYLKRVRKLCYRALEGLQILIITDHTVNDVVNQSERLKTKILLCFHDCKNKAAV